MVLTRLNSQQPRRRDATRRSKVLPCQSPRNNSRVARPVTTRSCDPQLLYLRATPLHDG
jgi:hypothetical protein